MLNVFCCDGHIFKSALRSLIFKSLSAIMSDLYHKAVSKNIITPLKFNHILNQEKKISMKKS